MQYTKTEANEKKIWDKGRRKTKDKNPEKHGKTEEKKQISPISSVIAMGYFSGMIDRSFNSLHSFLSEYYQSVIFLLLNTSSLHLNEKCNWAKNIDKTIF